jgi:hypothetical protein
MNQAQYDAAEVAYRQYEESNQIVPELLFAWLLVEVHFASTVTDVQSTVLGALPETDIEKALVIGTATIYREFRQDVKRQARVKPTGDMHAVRPKNE